MTAGLLLDTHTQLWLTQGIRLSLAVRQAISEAGNNRTLFLSDISLWELGVGQTKRNLDRRPNLDGLSPAEWTARFATRFRVGTLQLSSEAVAEAALLPARFDHKDPGDCHLMATAHLYNLALVTHDRHILELAGQHTAYLPVIAC